MNRLIFTWAGTLWEVTRVTNIILFILTGLQCSESIWFHGKHFLGRKNKFLWEETSRISAVRSNEQKVIYCIRICIHYRWKVLNLFRTYHKNGERNLKKQTYQKFKQNHVLTLRLYIFPCFCQHCISKLGYQFLAPKILFITIFKATLYIYFFNQCTVYISAWNKLFLVSLWCH